MNIIRKYCLIGITLMAGCSSAPQKGQEYTFKEVGWTMTLPPEFKIMDSANNAALSARGKKAMEESNDIKMDFSGTRTLITAMKGGTSNYFTSTLTAFDPQKDGDYVESTKSVKDMVYKTFLDKMPDVKMDSSSSPVMVGGLQFDKFHVIVAMKDKVLFDMFMLSKLYKGYDFGISYLYLDEASRQQIESILKSSKFH